MFAFARNLVKSAEGIIAAEDSAQPTPDSDPAYGFRVIHVDQSSNASEAGFEALFDFIVGINGHPLSEEVPATQMDIVQTTLDSPPPIDLFVTEVLNCAGKSVSFQVWSSKGRVARTVVMEVPNVDVGEVGESFRADLDSGTDTIASSSVGLGMSLQWTPLAVSDHVWHVLNVAPNSPAEQAGLISHADYIVGAQDGLLAAGGESLLGRVVSTMMATNSQAEIELYVYNHDYDILRPVRIRPNPHWGGTGLLGCGVGYGLLHRVPVVIGKFDQLHRRRKSSIYRRSDGQPGLGGQGQGQNQSLGGQTLGEGLLPPGGTLFEATSTNSGDEADVSNFITPANLDDAAPHVAPPTAPPAGPPTGPPPTGHASVHKKKHKPTDLTDYFAEEEKKSREVEGRDTKSKNSSDIAPPPKADSHEKTESPSEKTDNPIPPPPKA